MEKILFAPKIFTELPLSGIKGYYILLDIDGTLVNDGSENLSAETLAKIKELRINNKIVLCSNKKNYRARILSIAKQASIPWLDIPHKKPSKKIMKYINNQDGLPLLVIGDKLITDGLFAARIGARFIKVMRIASPQDDLFTKIVYNLDDLVSRVVIFLKL